MHRSSWVKEEKPDQAPGRDDRLQASRARKLLRQAGQLLVKGLDGMHVALVQQFSTKFSCRAACTHATTPGFPVPCKRSLYHERIMLYTAVITPAWLSVLPPSGHSI